MHKWAIIKLFCLEYESLELLHYYSSLLLQLITSYKKSLLLYPVQFLLLLLSFYYVPITSRLFSSCTFSILLYFSNTL